MFHPPFTMATTEPDRTTLQALFRSVTPRFQQYLPINVTQVELMPGVSLEDLASSDSITWSGLLAFLSSNVVWMAPHVYLCSEESICENPLFSHILHFDDWKPEFDTTYAAQLFAMEQEVEGGAVASTCDFIFRLLAASEQRYVHVGSRTRNSGSVPASLPVSGPVLSSLLERDHLSSFTLAKIRFNQEQCRVFATVSRSSLEINLEACSFADDATGAFIECLQNDRGPTKLDRCQIDSGVLAAALTGNSRVTSLRLPSNRTEDGAGVGLLFGALRNNRGLVDLNFSSRAISHENWMALCQSLQAHPAVQSLDLRFTRPMSPTGSRLHLSEEQKRDRTRAIVEMLQRNTVLHVIYVFNGEYDWHIYADLILPRLETNLFRPRVLAIGQSDSQMRRALIGRVLQSQAVMSNPRLLRTLPSGDGDSPLRRAVEPNKLFEKKPNLIWMFLSGNPDIFARCVV
jgi:hypothetical protein